MTSIVHARSDSRPFATDSSSSPAPTPAGHHGGWAGSGLARPPTPSAHAGEGRIGIPGSFPASIPGSTPIRRARSRRCGTDARPARLKAGKPRTVIVVDALGAGITFAAGVGGVGLGALLARRNERRSANDRLLVEALNDVVGAVAEVANDVPGAQAKYASATSRIALHAPPAVVRAFREFQDVPTTATREGRDRLVAALKDARQALGHGSLLDDDIATLLFGAHRGSFAVRWNKEKRALGVELVEANGAPDVHASPAMASVGGKSLSSTPLAAIEEAYGAMHARLADLAKQRGLRTNGGPATAALLDAGVLSERTAHAIDGIEAMRSLAVTAPDADRTPERAEEFVSLVDALMFAIEHDARAAASRSS